MDTERKQDEKPEVFDGYTNTLRFRFCGAFKEM